VVSTHLKNISQSGSFPQVRVKSNKYLKPTPRGKLAENIENHSYNTWEMPSFPSFFEKKTSPTTGHVRVSLSQSFSDI